MTERIGIALLFFCSGFSALLYEVLWMRELSLLLGSGHLAASITVAAFFLGIAAGARYWGGRLQRANTGLATYGRLELGVAAGGLLFWGLFNVWHHDVPIWLDAEHSSRPIRVGLSFAIAFLAMFPAVFCLGGTLPAIGQALLRFGQSGGRFLALVYGLNLAGAACGALAAGAGLPYWLGYDGAYQVALGLSTLCGTAALIMARRRRDADFRPAVLMLQTPLIRTSLPWLAVVVTFMSGFVGLGLQVTWTRMFSQVLQNSVYTFAVVLTVFLLALSAGAAIVRRAWSFDPGVVLFASLLAVALLTAASPPLFLIQTDAMAYQGKGQGGWQYLGSVGLLVATTIGPAVLALGMVFPSLMRRVGGNLPVAAAALGRLSAWNTLGSIAGALTSGLLLPALLGLWDSIALYAALTLVTAYMVLHKTRVRFGQRAVLGVLALSLPCVLGFRQAPLVSIYADESVLKVWESGAGIVAVVAQTECTESEPDATGLPAAVECRSSLKITQDNHYTLGGTGSAVAEAMQGRLPVALHASPRSVLLIGLGTGISAGGALQPGVEELVATELLPDAITAARDYFADHQAGLFGDPRTQILPVDGRQFLASTQRRFDVVIGDLFVPWHVSAGDLYSRQHFRTVRQHLAPGGWFMQWLPAYQLSRAEFLVILKTLMAEFPRVTLWRGDFSQRTPIIGLLAQTDEAPLPALRHVGGTSDERLLLHYLGRAERLEALLAEVALNTDDSPVITYRAPWTQRLQKLGEAQWLTGDALLALLDTLRDGQGFNGDDMLARLPAPVQRLPEAGYCLQASAIRRQEGYLADARRFRECYERIAGPKPAISASH